MTRPQIAPGAADEMMTDGDGASDERRFNLLFDFARLFELFALLLQQFLVANHHECHILIFEVILRDL